MNYSQGQQVKNVRKIDKEGGSVAEETKLVKANPLYEKEYTVIARELSKVFVFGGYAGFIELIENFEADYAIICEKTNNPKTPLKEQFEELKSGVERYSDISILKENIALLREALFSINDESEGTPGAFSEIIEKYKAEVPNIEKFFSSKAVEDEKLWNTYVERIHAEFGEIEKELGELGKKQKYVMTEYQKLQNIPTQKKRGLGSVAAGVAIGSFLLPGIGSVIGGAIGAKLGETEEFICPDDFCNAAVDFVNEYQDLLGVLVSKYPIFKSEMYALLYNGSCLDEVKAKMLLREGSSADEQLIEKIYGLSIKATILVIKDMYSQVAYDDVTTGEAVKMCDEYFTS